jgi:hypothetical protein
LEAALRIAAARANTSARSTSGRGEMSLMAAGFLPPLPWRRIGSFLYLFFVCKDERERLTLAES